MAIFVHGFAKIDTQNQPVKFAPNHLMINQPYGHNISNSKDAICIFRLVQISVTCNNRRTVEAGRHLILILSLFPFTLHGVDSHLFVILLQRREILAGLRELSLLHALPDVPVDEGALGVHQVELVVEAGPSLGDGGRVAQHADGSLHLGEVSSGHDRRRLVVDADLKAGGTPVDELDRALRLDGGDGGVDVLGYDVSAVQHAARHVLSVARVALHHLVGRLKAGVRDLRHRQLLVVRLFGRDDRGVGGEGEVDARVWHQVGLKLGQVDVERAVEAQRRRDRADDLRDQPVQVGVRGTLDVQVTPTDVVDRLIVDHEGAVGVL